MSGNQDIGEQAISKAAEVGLKSQLEAAEDLDVDVRTSPQKIVGGEVESVTIEGKGLAMQDDLRTEKLQVKTGTVSIDPFQAAFGNIELEQTAEAQAEMTLTEADITRAFNSDYLRQKLASIPLEINGQTTAAQPRQIQFQLPGEGKAHLQAAVDLVDLNEQRQVAFTAVPAIGEDGQQIVLEQVTYENDTDAENELTAAILDSAQALLNLKNFELDGMALKLHELQVQPGKLTISARGVVQSFPA
ncbi:MAG: DUF2993 domain-containing protein [Leptolyngbya sp. SIO4C1]|nr:DUF2993 domain-containing protein [Leptolyngbya sp. SIO4C1]